MTQLGKRSVRQKERERESRAERHREGRDGRRIRVGSERDPSLGLKAIQFLKEGCAVRRGRKVISRADSKSQVRQWLGFCTADFWSYESAYESAEQKPKHCLT